LMVLKEKKRNARNTSESESRKITLNSPVFGSFF
jgi:hypothetical protein